MGPGEGRERTCPVRVGVRRGYLAREEADLFPPLYSGGSKQLPPVCTIRSDKCSACDFAPRRLRRGSEEAGQEEAIYSYWRQRLGRSWALVTGGGSKEAGREEAIYSCWRPRLGRFWAVVNRGMNSSG